MSSVKDKDASHGQPGTSELEKLLDITKSAGEPDGNIDVIRQKLADQALLNDETRREGQQKYYELRDEWSSYIRNFVWAMILYQVLLTAAIGREWLDFTEYKTFLMLVVGQNFAQIIGMGVIVAKFLFSDRPHK